MLKTLALADRGVRERERAQPVRDQRDLLGAAARLSDGERRLDDRRQRGGGALGHRSSRVNASLAPARDGRSH